MFVKIFFQLIAEKQLTKLARLLTYQEKLLLRQHTLTQRKRRQKNRLICIQLRLLRTRFEIKDTWIENDFDLFFWGGGGWRGEMENCAYLRKNPGYAPDECDFKVTMHLQIDNFLQIWTFESKYCSKCDL